ncbi:hypothetical protein DV736_g6051, partial [Chaetothyriales sp. CBS 134916]
MPSVLPFEQQPLEAPLNDEAKRKLREMAAKPVNDYSLYSRVNKAMELLDKSVGPLIDRGVEKKELHEKKQARLAGRGEEQDATEQERYEAFQRKVQELTKSMDQTIRQVVDMRVWLEELPDALKEVTDTASTQTQSVQQTTQQSGILPTQDVSPRPFDPDTDEDGDGEAPQSSTQALPSEKTPSAVLKAALTAQESNWSNKTLTDKYAHDNDYIGWYTSRWNALNPGDTAPPMPSAAIWFAAEEGRPQDGPFTGAPAQNGDDNSNQEDDSNIEITHEKINIKCPITLMPFEDPVRSSKCNHSFEKTAILGMLQQSNDRRELTPEQEARIATIRNMRDRIQQREQLQRLQPCGIKCPECRTFFLEEDLRPDPVLKRRVQRQLEWQRKQDERARLREEEGDEDMESDDDDGDELRGAQGWPVGLGSSPERLVADRRSGLGLLQKEERKTDLASGRVPEMQQPSGPPSRATASVVDLDEDI